MTNAKIIPFSLEHRQLLSPSWERMCLAENLPFAEYSFCNNFLFRRQHDYCLINENLLLVRGKFSRGGYYHIPTTPLTNDVIDAVRKENETPFTFFPVSQKWLSGLDSDSLQVEAHREDADYLYHAEKLKTLSGRALSSRRNLLHQFTSQHGVEVKNLTKETTGDALIVLEEWLAQSKISPETTDYMACIDALQLFDVLGLIGRIVYADGIPVGFSLGELLTPTVALLHFAKSKHDYKGVTPFLYQDFAMQLPDSVIWINLEQDMGIPSLRQAKEAYEPDLISPKYRVTVNYVGR